MKKNYFDIVILPPEDVSHYAIKLSKELERYGTKWTLGRKSFIPHISLYYITVRPKNFKVFIGEIKRTIENFSPGYLRTTVVEPNFLIFDKPKAKKFKFKLTQVYICELGLSHSCQRVVAKIPF